jgi:phage gp29-like protein
MRQPDQTVFQQIPLLTNWRVTDNVSQLREILVEHEMGYFLSSSVFWEEMLSDPRIGAVIDTRIGGLLSADLHFQPAYEHARKAQKLAEMLGGHDQTEDDGLWLRMMDPDTAAELLKWKIGLGVAYGPIEWDTRDGQWVPRIIPWHPRFLRFDWSRWQFAVVTWGQPIVWLPRTDEEARSDGKWFFWGGYRSWMTGLVRSLGMAYIDRCWEERDWARYCEKYGLNIVEGKVPSTATPEEKADFHRALANLGNEPTLTTPQGRSKDDASFGLEIHECTAQGWQTFKTRKEALDTDIAVRVLGQNLTTEVKGGSLAASKVHEGIRGDVKRRDAHFFKACREQLLCWWALYNYGDPELAPYPRPEIQAALDPVDEATQLLTLMQAVQIAPVEVDSASIMEAHGVPVLEGQALEEAKATRAAMQPAGLPGQQPGQKLLGLVKPKDVSDETAGKMAAAIAGDDAEPEKLTASIGEIVALKSGPPSVVKRRQFYSAARLEKARKMAAGALEPELESLLTLIRKASSLQEIHEHVLREARKPGASVERLAKLTERMNVLAGLEGRKDALVGALK